MTTNTENRQPSGICAVNRSEILLSDVSTKNAAIMMDTVPKIILLLFREAARIRINLSANNLS
jgi:hypothetical protein